MPSKLNTGQIDSGKFVEFFHKKLSGHASGYYPESNPQSFVPIADFTGYSGVISTRADSQSTFVSGALDNTGQLLFSKSASVSGHAESFTTGASGALASKTTSLSGLFAATTGQLLSSGSFFHASSGDFSTSAATGALAFSSGDNNLYVATGDTTSKANWMQIAGYPTLTGFVSTTSGDLQTNLNTTGTTLSNKVTNILSDSSVSFTAQKTFESGIKTNKIVLSGDGVTLRVNANDTVTFDDASGALLTLAPGYGADTPSFSVTDKAGLPLIDVYDDDRLNFGPYGKNPFNISGERVYFGNYKSYISGSTISFSGDPLTVNDVFTVSGLSGGYVFFNGLPEWPNIGGLNSGALFRSGNAGAGPSVLCVV